MDTEPVKKPSFFHRLAHWIRLHRTRSICGLGAALILIAGGVTYYLLSRPLPVTDVTPIQAEKPAPAPKFYAPLTGLEIKSEADASKPVTAVMIENSPDARPQSGLKDAEVVYEALAEGGITRFMAIYQQSKPTLIGPVRSVRPYYLDWEIPYNASIAHVGGSYEALKRVRSGKYRDIDQFFNAGSYWRSTDRYAPHNVYTNFKLLDALNKAKGYKTSHPTGFERGDVEPAATPTATKISVQISGPLFNSSYRYDTKHDYYLRSQAGAPHKDREKGVIHPKVVIALYMDEGTFSDGSHQKITTTGSGKAVIFQGGKAVKATWHRSSLGKQYTFTDKNDREILLARGQTWVAAIPSGSGSVSWK